MLCYHNSAVIAAREAGIVKKEKMKNALNRMPGMAQK